MKCKDCKLGKTVQVVLDNNPERSSNTYIRCPFENTFYKKVDDECCFPKTAYRKNKEHDIYTCSLCYEVLPKNINVCPGCNATIVERKSYLDEN